MRDAESSSTQMTGVSLTCWLQSRLRRARRASLVYGNINSASARAGHKALVFVPTTTKSSDPSAGAQGRLGTEQIQSELIQSCNPEHVVPPNSVIAQLAGVQKGAQCSCKMQAVDSWTQQQSFCISTIQTDPIFAFDQVYDAPGNCIMLLFALSEAGPATPCQALLTAEQPSTWC